MTIVPMYKKCPKCKKSYSWNPDVGKMWCPNCGPLGFPRGGDSSLGEKIIEILLGKNQLLENYFTITEKRIRNSENKNKKDEIMKKMDFVKKYQVFGKSRVNFFHYFVFFVFIF